MLSVKTSHAEVGGKAILKGLTLDVPARRGARHRVGPNGAGKSTLVLRPDRPRRATR